MLVRRRAFLVASRLPAIRSRAIVPFIRYSTEAAAPQPATPTTPPPPTATTPAPIESQTTSQIPTAPNFGPIGTLAKSDTAPDSTAPSESTPSADSSTLTTSDAPVAALKQEQPKTSPAAAKSVPTTPSVPPQKAKAKVVAKSPPPPKAAPKAAQKAAPKPSPKATPKPNAKAGPAATPKAASASAAKPEPPKPTLPITLASVRPQPSPGPFVPAQATWTPVTNTQASAEAVDTKLSNSLDINWEVSFFGAGTQRVTSEQFEILTKPLRSEDIEVKPDGVIYLPEIKYRRRLNETFGPMGWSLIPRGEPVVGDSIVTREYALIVNGRFVSQAQGENNYFGIETLPSAVEGCKSNALMRCCKDLGIASELWDPIYIRWFRRTNLTEVWVEHVTTKKKRTFWYRKDMVEVAYPYRMAK